MVDLRSPHNGGRGGVSLTCREKTPDMIIGVVRAELKMAFSIFSGRKSDR